MNRTDITKENRSGAQKRRSNSAFHKKMGATVVWLLLCSFTVVGGDLAHAASKKPLSDIDKLEMKFFHQTYDKSDMDSRIDRVEKMVFGEAKEGSESDRLAKLIQVVPDLEVEEPAPVASGDQNVAAQESRPEPRADAGTDYPAVAAIEKKLFGRDFSDDPVAERLNRLETKVYGKPTKSSDLVDRMDRLKSSTGVDIARQAPSGTDWVDEDDLGDIDYPKPESPVARGYPSVSPYGSSGGSGAYGMSSGGSTSGGGSSGSYGFGGGSSSGFGSSSSGFGGSSSGFGSIASAPRTAPPISRSVGSSSYASPGSISGASSMGLNQQVEALEKEIFGSVDKKNSLPDRITKLEKTVFASQQGVGRGSLPQRVSRLISVVPISTPSTVASRPQMGQQSIPSSMPSSLPTVDPTAGLPQQQQRGGLSKLLGSLGNFISGGMSVGGYPTTGNLYTDPTTGYLVDRMSGNLIDPHTGRVVRYGSGGYPTVTPNYGYGSFNNGFSPYYGNPYGGAGGIRFGGSGLNFGTGMGGFGGMWP